jgi:hypothetical protein
VGIGYVDFTVPNKPGTAAAIAEFYRRFFDAEVAVTAVDAREDEIPQEPTTATFISGRCQSSVKLGNRQYLRFTEASANEEVPTYDGHHICVYISEFADVYQRMENSSYELLWINPRFLSTASNNLEEALQQSEFRFKDIINTETNEVVYELEHEVRRFEHRSCCLKHMT